MKIDEFLYGVREGVRELLEYDNKSESKQNPEAEQYVEPNQLDIILAKWNSLADFVEALGSFVLASFLFGLGGFFGVVFGIMAILFGVTGVGSGIYRMKGKADLSNRTKDYFSKERIRLAKRAIEIIIIIVIIVICTRFTVISDVKKCSFDSYGTENIGTIVDKNLKGAKWKSKKLYDGVYSVSASGFDKGRHCSADYYFTYAEEDDDSFTIELKYVILDGEELNQFETMIYWSSLYD